MRRFLLLYIAPTTGLLLATVLPVMRGTETYYHRDLLQAHFGLKTAQARAWHAGYVPEIDVYRAGGQPLAGNPNSVPFYPDNLLYLVAPLLWALDAHLWLHWLIAPLGAFWLGRAWGLSRPASWAVGVVYGLSGFFVSHLAFYNLIAGAALTPALVAACLKAQEIGARERAPETRRDPDQEEISAGSDERSRPLSWPHSRRRYGALLAAVGGLWALLIVSGDPFMALLAFLLAASAVWVRARTLRPRTLLRRVPVGLLAVAFAGGTLLAAPQWVEFLRILPLSFRGHFGFGGGVGVIESFDPRQILEWFLPLCFGRPDRVELASFWGWDLYTGFPPYYYSLYPGLLALALLVCSGRPRSRRAWWAWGSIAFGFFFSLGGFNPGAAWLFEQGLLRYPVKFWMPVALGASLLCGLGFERVFLEGRRRRFALTLAALFVVYAAGLGVLQIASGPSGAFLRALIPERYSDRFVANELLRWSGLALFSLLLLALAGLAFRALRSRPRVAGAVILLIHVASQLFFLAPLRATDAALPYTVPPPTLAEVPEDALVVHGSYVGLFGKGSFEVVRSPSPDTFWYTRRSFYELYPTTGPLWGRRYQLNVSPEGLDGFVTEVSRSALSSQTGSDLERLRMLRAWGVDVLLLGRELEPEARRLVARVDVVPGFGTRQWVYTLNDPAPEVLFAGRVETVPHINAAVGRLIAADFDPRRTVVIPGEEDDGEDDGEDEEAGAEKATEAGAQAGAGSAARAGEVQEGLGGTARFVTRGPESFEVDVDAWSAGVLMVQRAHLDLWRATVTGERRDGTEVVDEEVAILPANIQRLGVALEPGRYRVRFWIDRRPLVLSAAMALLGAALLGVLAWSRFRNPEAHGTG
jgi:hypothetical protein